ncbi:hypothetical protein NDU88_000706 [Pleurodeles waltl]|uniref:Uncharacterized protein n=1 Tax=Pleurodeles waltl TaxID=8319 RepID=A0AAV7MLA6_PLEWA|nr:hypothetical protein NDU88_000706 [Pleurodeles waltl]
MRGAPPKSERLAPLASSYFNADRAAGHEAPDPVSTALRTSSEAYAGIPVPARRQCKMLLHRASTSPGVRNKKTCIQYLH